MLQKAAEFDAQLSQLNKEQDLRKKNRDKNKVFNDNLQLQFRDGILLWRTALWMEHGLIEAQFQKADQIDKQKLDAAKDKLLEAQVQEARLIGNREDKDPTFNHRLQHNQDEQTQWTNMENMLEKHIASRKRNFEDTLNVAENDKVRETLQLIKAGHLLTGTQPFRMPVMPDTTVTFAGWTTEISDDQAGAKFQWNRVITTGVRENFNPSEHSAEFVAFIELFKKVQIFAGTKVQLTDQGVIQVPVGGIEIKPGIDIQTPVGGIAVKPKTRPEELPGSETWKIELPKP